MKELGKKYFSSISKQINGISYEQFKPNHYETIYFDDISDQATYNKVNTALNLEGFCIIQTNRKHLDSRERTEKICATLFGEPFCDKNPGERAYAKIQPMKNAKYFVNSHLAQPLHTDEGYTTRFPRYVALHCSQAASSGGDSIIVQFQSLYLKLIKLFGGNVDLLFEREAVTVQHAFGIEKKPIFLRLENDNVGISYSPIFHKMWCSNEVFEQFDYITQYIHTPHNQLRFTLKASQTLIFDNCKVLHGRSAFPKNDSRLLCRYWFKDTAL